MAWGGCCGCRASCWCACASRCCRSDGGDGGVKPVDERTALAKAGKGAAGGRAAWCGCDKYVRRCIGTFALGVVLCMVFGFIPTDPGRPTSVPRMNYWVYQFANLQWFSFGSASQHILSYATAIPGPGGRPKLAIMVFSNLVCAGFATLLYFTNNINNTLGRVYPGFVPPLVMLAFYTVWTVVKLEPQYARLRRHAQARRVARMLARNQRGLPGVSSGSLAGVSSGSLVGVAGLQARPAAATDTTAATGAGTSVPAIDGSEGCKGAAGAASMARPPLGTDAARGMSGEAMVPHPLHPRASRSGSAPIPRAMAINDSDASLGAAAGGVASNASLVVPSPRSRRSGSMVVGRYLAPLHGAQDTEGASVRSGLAHHGSAGGSPRAAGAPGVVARVPHSPSTRRVRFLSDGTRASSAPLLASVSFGGMSDLSNASQFYATLTEPDVHKECNIVLDWVEGDPDTGGATSLEQAEQAEARAMLYGTQARANDAPGRFVRAASSTDTSFSAVSGRFKLYRRPLLQLVAAACFSWLIVAIYLFCEWFAVSFQKSGSSAQQHQTIYYALFVLITLAIKAVLKMVGFVADMGKHGCSPCYFQGELIGLLNYYNFYRLLFANVETSWVFAGLQFLHCTHEWVVYPMRATSWYYHASTRVTRRMADSCCKPLQAVLRTVAQSQLSEEEWTGFICMDYGLRCATELVTMVVFVSAFTWMRFGYNSQHFLFFAAVSDERYRRVMYYCAVAFVVELINVAAAQLLFFRPRKLSVMGRLSNLFRNKSFILYALASVGSLSINIFISNVDVAQLAHNSPIPSA